MKTFAFLALLVVAASAARVPEQIKLLQKAYEHRPPIERHWTVALAASGTHYGNPANGCQADEEAVQVQGLSGDFCSPKCSSTTPCPTDVPAGTTVKPQCALEVQGSSSPSMCALICSPLKPGGCPTGASCAKINVFEGLCTYPTGYERSTIARPTIGL